jgi:NosR/NirI family nitrous oxide reductase transcriptional regulator
MVLDFVTENKVKLIATAIIGTLFFYFWVEGPLPQLREVISLEDVKTKFSSPNLVTKESFESHETSGTIEDSSIDGFGHGLILNRDLKERESGLIASIFDEDENSEDVAEKILSHVSQLDKIEREWIIRQNESFSYAQDGDNGPTIYIESERLVSNVHGYAGVINVGVFIDASGNVASVHHVSSHETASYLRKILSHDYYERFKDLDLSQEYRIDAVSGATLTTQAIASTVTQVVKMSNPDPIENFSGISNIHLFSVSANLSWHWMVHIVVIFLIFLFGFQKKIRKSKKGIIVLNILSLVYIGFYLNNSFTYVSFLHPFLGTSISSLVGLYALFVLLGAIWGKNTYCKYVCPFGNAQRVTLLLTPKKYRSKFFLPNKWIKRFRDAITLVLIGGVLFGFRQWSNFELFPDLFGLEIRSLWWVASILLVLMSAKYPMIWCRLLCPTGSVLDAISEIVQIRRMKSTGLSGLFSKISQRKTGQKNSPA